MYFLFFDKLVWVFKCSLQKALCASKELFVGLRTIFYLKSFSSLSLCSLLAFQNALGLNKERQRSFLRKSLKWDTAILAQSQRGGGLHIISDNVLLQTLMIWPVFFPAMYSTSLFSSSSSDYTYWAVDVATHFFVLDFRSGSLHIESSSNWLLHIERYSDHRRSNAAIFSFL